MTYPRVVIINWLALLLAMLYSCQAMPAHAGVFLEGQLGASYMVNTAPDGRWRQDAFGVSYEGVKLAYGGRIGWRFEQPYSVQIGYTSFGTNRTESPFVWDHCYNDKAHTVQCGDKMYLKTADTMRAYTLSGTRYFRLSEAWSVPVSLGAALVTHRLQAISTNRPTDTQERYGRMPMWSIGAGLCWQERICWENTLYTALPGQNYHDPTSEQVLTSLLGIRYAFGN